MADENKTILDAEMADLNLGEKKSEKS